MPYDVTFKEVDDRGKYSLATFEYKGKDWKMGVWDKKLREALDSMEDGDEATIDTKKNGNYTNLVGIAGIEKEQKKSAPRPKEKAKWKDDNEMRRHPDIMTLLSLMEGLLSTGKFSTEEEVLQLAKEMWPVAKVINTGFDKAQTSSGDDEDIPF